MVLNSISHKERVIYGRHIFYITNPRRVLTNGDNLFCASFFPQQPGTSFFFPSLKFCTCSSFEWRSFFFGGRERGYFLGQDCLSHMICFLTPLLTKWRAPLVACFLIWMMNWRRRRVQKHPFFFSIGEQSKPTSREEAAFLKAQGNDMIGCVVRCG